jgi:glycerophosphoryl diester phosphodiesterase
LRAIERIPAVRQRNTMYNGYFEVPTLDEVLLLRTRLSKELRREIGVYPETKHPTYFAALGNPLEAPLVRALKRHDLDNAHAPAFVQSFEAVNLRELAAKVRTRLVFLANGSGAPFNDPRSYDDYLTPSGLAELATFGKGVGPAKNRVIPVRPDGSLGDPTSLVGDAHAAGLAVHPWTLRAKPVSPTGASGGHRPHRLRQADRRDSRVPARPGSTGSSPTIRTWVCWRGTCCESQRRRVGRRARGRRVAVAGRHRQRRLRR